MKKKKFQGCSTYRSAWRRLEEPQCTIVAHTTLPYGNTLVKCCMYRSPGHNSADITAAICAHRPSHSMAKLKKSNSKEPFILHECDPVQPAHDPDKLTSPRYTAASRKMKEIKPLHRNKCSIIRIKLSNFASTNNALYTRAQSWQASSEAQPFKSLTSLQAPSNFSKCILAILKGRYEGGNDTKQNKAILITSQRVFESPLAWGLQKMSLSSRHS